MVCACIHVNDSCRTFSELTWLRYRSDTLAYRLRTHPKILSQLNAGFISQELHTPLEGTYKLFGFSQASLALQTTLNISANMNPHILNLDFMSHGLLPSPRELTNSEFELSGSIQWIFLCKFYPGNPKPTFRQYLVNLLLGRVA